MQFQLLGVRRPVAAFPFLEPVSLWIATDQSADRSARSKELTLPRDQRPTHSDPCSAARARLIFSAAWISTAGTLHT